MGLTICNKCRRPMQAPTFSLERIQLCLDCAIELLESAKTQMVSFGTYVERWVKS